MSRQREAADGGNFQLRSSVVWSTCCDSDRTGVMVEMKEGLNAFEYALEVELEEEEEEVDVVFTFIEPSAFTVNVLPTWTLDADVALELALE